MKKKLIEIFNNPQEVAVFLVLFLFSTSITEFSLKYLDKSFSLDLGSTISSFWLTVFLFVGFSTVVSFLKSQTKNNKL